MKRATVLAGGLALSACATTVTPQARLHSQDELNLVGRRCGVALGELFQDESETRLVFLLRSGTTAEQRTCIADWARRNGLRPVFVNMSFES